MKTDKTTKALLTVIAALLGILLLQPSVGPSAQAAIPGTGRFANLTFSGGMGGFWMFNHDTGEIYSYDGTRPTAVVKYVGTFDAPGKPLVGIPNGNLTRAKATNMVTASRGEMELVAEDDANTRYTVRDKKTGILTTIYWDRKTNAPAVTNGDFGAIP